MSLRVEVTDAEETLFESIPLTVKAEAHDVVIEWSNHVDFKLMHVGETKKENVLILNKSPYDVGYLLRLPKCLQNLISLNPSEGGNAWVGGFQGRLFVECGGDDSLRQGRRNPGISVIEASFFDPVKNELLFPVQSIPVSGEAWYNRFTIKPACIDFGFCVVNQSKKCSFELQNTGHFPLNFRLFNYKNGPALLQQEDEEGVGKKQRKSAKPDPGFQLGVFTVSPSSGTVAVGKLFHFRCSLYRRHDQIIGRHLVYMWITVTQRRRQKVFLLSLSPPQQPLVLCPTSHPLWTWRLYLRNNKWCQAILNVTRRCVPTQGILVPFTLALPSLAVGWRSDSELPIPVRSCAL
ncbi:hypothetical protein C3747_138g2 [Trypanosoma cruzi]|uniref:Uncharacterized protein n=1 Tax=Trypanosoma cruzi TaxID=5693 RepID=A0A2V2W9Q5_TRYCR|nr:hypothetical protein C3747_138g2 [Trypanosoma cruzi]